MTTSYNAPIPYNAELGYNGLPPIVTAAQLPTLELRVTSKNGAKSPLPEAIVDSMSFESSMAGSISLSVADGTVGADLTDDYSVVDLYMNGEIVEDGRWLLRNKSWNEGKTVPIRAFTGKSLLWDRLSKTVVWDDKRYFYSVKTPGHILNDLFAEAQNRGAFNPNFTWTFDQTMDSDGNAWPVVLSIEYLAGAKYNDIVANFLDRELIDISLLGDEVRVLVGGKRGKVRPGMLIVGEDVTDAPQQGTTEGIASHVIVVGDEGKTVIRENPVTTMEWGREEVSVSQGGTLDAGTLSIVGDVELSNGTGPRIQRTYNMVINQDRKLLPLRDYLVGDFIAVEHGNANRLSLRVKQIVFKREKGRWTGSLVLNDKFLEADVRLAKKVDGILGGASIVSSSRNSTPDDLKDTGIPNPPTGILVDTESYLDQNGNLRVLAVFQWDPVITNTDGTVATDIQYQSLRWRYSDEPSDRTRYAWSDDNTLVLSNLDPARDVVAFLYVNDTSGNFSARSPEVTFRTADDTVAPPTPSGPFLANQRRTLTVSWDGLTSTGAMMPSDFRHVQVWTSHFNAFTPGDGNSYLEGVLTHKGDMVVSLYNYVIGSIVYVRFIAVDHSGNKSEPSAINWQTVQGVQGFDIEFGAVGANAIGAGVIGTQHMKAGAVDTARLTLGPTMNLVQDPSFNDAEWRVQRLTTRWSDRPDRWFFKDSVEFIRRNGYYLQMLSTPAGENGGRMYVTDWIGVQYGETYYFGIYARNGEFAPSADARIFMGVEVTKSDGSIQSDGLIVDPTDTWTKYGFNMPVGDVTWIKMRFFVRADNLHAGDFVMDDWEVRSAVGTTAVAGPRVTVTPLGMEMFNTSEIQTVWMSAETGDVNLLGTISSGYEGRRIQINPGETYLPEIRFFGLEGENYAYINASSSISTFPFIGINSPDIVPSQGQTLIMHNNGFAMGHTDRAAGLLMGPGLEGIGLGASGYIALVGKIGNTGSALDAASSLFQDAVVGDPGATLLLALPPTPASGQWYPFYTIWRSSNITFSHHMTGRTVTQWHLLIQRVGATALTNINTRVYQWQVRSD